MNMCFEWCLVKAHKAQEIDPLLVKLTHLSGLKGQRASGGSTPPFWKREMKGRGNFNSVKHLTESGQPVGHTGQLTCGTWRQTFPNSNGLCYILIFDKRARKISTMVLYLNQKLCETVFFLETRQDEGATYLVRLRATLLSFFSSSDLSATDEFSSSSFSSLLMSELLEECVERAKPPGRPRHERREAKV